MAYAKDGIIENTDVNDTLLNPADAANRLNAIWGVGKGNRGYGQGGFISPVQKGDIVYAWVWQSMVERTQRIANHEGKAMSFDSIYPGQSVLYNEGLTKTQIEQVDEARTSAAIQGYPYYYGRENLYTWQNQLKYTITCYFKSPDQARYFWNCGGQFAMSLYQPDTAGKPITKLFNQLANDMGTIYWSVVPGGGKKTIINTVEFDAVTSLGGSGTPVTIAKDIDYYNPSLYNSVTGLTLFEQKVTNTIPAYSNSYVKVLASTSGTKGINGDNGNTIVLQVIFDSVPDGAVMPAGGRIAFTVIPPAMPNRLKSYLYTDTWGAPTVTISSTAI